MTINELLKELQELSADGEGDAILQIEESGMGFAGPLIGTDGLIGVNGKTYLILLATRTGEYIG